MKKLLLSSIIMFGVCGIVAAQSATDAKFKAKPATPGNSISPVPQKSASAADMAPAVAPVATTSADVDAARSPEKVAIMAGKQPKIATATTTVNAAGEVVAADDATPQRPVEKAAAAKAANAKKTKGN